MTGVVGELLSCPECGSRAIAAGPEGTAGKPPNDASAIVATSAESTVEFACPNGHTWTLE